MPLSTRRKYSFYIGLFLVLVFYWGYGSIIFAVSFSEGINYLMLAFALLFYFLGGYTVRFYFRNAPIFHFSPTEITVRGQSYSWSSIQSISFIGQKPFRYLRMRHMMNAITLEMKDGSSLYIFEKMYSNVPAIKELLQEKIDGHLVAETPTPVEADNTPTISQAAQKRMQRKIKAIGIGYIICMLVASAIISIPNFSTTTETILKLIFVAIVFASALLFRKLLTRLMAKAVEETRNGI